MGTVYTFTPRQGSGVGVDVRAKIEEAAQAALDTAERLIVILDRMDGNPDDGDGDLSFGAPEEHSSQIIIFRGSTQDLEA